MYKITFESQPRHDEPDAESNSIVLTKEEYYKLPILSVEQFDEKKCTFHAGTFAEQVRRPEKIFPAVGISNPEWKLEGASELSGGYLDDSITWTFVCLDMEDDIWIGFYTCDYATLEDAYGSTVCVSEPSHGPIHRLDEGCMEIVRRFYPKC